MPSVPVHSGEMSHDSERGPVHPSPVQADPPDPATPARLAPAIDPAARASRRMYEGLSASSVGLEFGIAVVVALLFGMWLDGRLGTEPWMMLIFLCIGLVAGFRNVLRAVALAERAAERTDRG
jgi:F0F1-type ATP synthase assembly protein I